MFVIVRDYFDDDIMSCPEIRVCATFAKKDIAEEYARYLFSEFKKDNSDEDATCFIDKVECNPSEEDCELIFGLGVNPNPEYVIGEYATNSFSDCYHNYYCVVNV